ncbi:acyl carrier protein, partial [Pedobacter cryoconitis]
RWLADGTIEFSGRKDDQVKIRGYRIEPGEIETALERHAAISAATVVVKMDVAGDKILVAYVVSADELDGTVMRSYLLERLPAYMVPAYFVRLEILPLTPNGKVDKRSLPSPEGLSISSGPAYVAPRSEVEEKLVLVWQELLGIKRIGMKDDFFTIGGHSLKATQLISRINREFEVDLSLVMLFNDPTVENMANKIEEIYWSGGELFENNDTQKFSI